MKTKEEKVREAIARLRKNNNNVEADRLEQSIEAGTIDLKPGNNYSDQLIFAALVFSDAFFIIDANPTYTFETK